MNGKTKKPKKASGRPSSAKPFFILLFIGFFFFVVGQQIFTWVRGSSYFRINRISCTLPSKARALDKFLYLQGKSILDVDLESLQRQLQNSFPEAEQVRAVKRFPDEIQIVFKERPPYALVAISGNYFTIDRQGFLVARGDVPGQTLPLIIGLGTPSRGVSLGQQVTSNNLKIALMIIDAFARSRDLRAFSVVKINVENTSKISFYLSDQLEVLMDKDNVDQRIDTLGIILSKAKLDWERIRNIDLRFQEPIIKYEP